MSNLFKYFSFLFLVLPTFTHAYEAYGICNYGKETVETVICTGPTVLKDTTVSGDVKVVGPLTAINVSAGSLTITGDVDLQNSTIKGSAMITGALNADTVQFKKDLQVAASAITLSHTRVAGSMTVSSSTENPYLKMECGTVIKGSLTFIGKAGVIQITDDSAVTGKIKNGSMEFVKKTC